MPNIYFYMIMTAVLFLSFEPLTGIFQLGKQNIWIQIPVVLFFKTHTGKYLCENGHYLSNDGTIFSHRSALCHNFVIMICFVMLLYPMTCHYIPLSLALFNTLPIILYSFHTHSYAVHDLYLASSHSHLLSSLMFQPVKR